MSKKKNKKLFKILWVYVFILRNCKKLSRIRLIKIDFIKNKKYIDYLLIY